MSHAQTPRNVAVAARIAQALTSPALRDLRRLAASLPRRTGTAPALLRFFYEPGDPYSHLAAQYLDRLLARFAVTLQVHLVPPPPDAAAPDRPRLVEWGMRDAQLLASRHGLALPAEAAPQPAPQIAALAAALAGRLDPAHFTAAALTAGQAFWSGAPPGPATADPAPALAAGSALRARLGHYLGGTFHFEGEWYWGVDRMHHLQARLHAAGLDRTPGVPGPAPCPEISLLPAATAGGRVLHFYCSLRSPYTYLAVPRAAALAQAYGAELRLRFVLPMVMRGLDVPMAKRIYITLDTKREAERLGMRFGHIADPVGAGAERGLAVLHHAIRRGQGTAFLLSFLAGVFSQGIDAATDSGLVKLAGRAGLNGAHVVEALADASWRDVAEANRQDMLARGLWGVPSFRVDEAPAVWGQDRLWVIEQELTH